MRRPARRKPLIREDKSCKSTIFGFVVSASLPHRPECGLNEHFDKCPRCEGTCDDPFPTCKTTCRSPKCQCIFGYVRYNGTCIPFNSCPNPRCPKNEFWSECGGSRCEATCEDPYLNQGNCVPGCTAGCECAPGFLRNNLGVCVDFHNCNHPCRNVICPFDEVCVVNANKTTTCVSRQCLLRGC
ncbi:hypothetical protein QR680_006292 [Steinernema hermaphroditum]|uniref:TIL domain-containing protein n=1 Tax=Steinernema hermaphroditum TaxID=289476 RepID=A0AA39HWE8_9BILA|nr:hypothetical protein QR680_006292 [Steinernema hermaphroditum]